MNIKVLRRRAKSIYKIIKRFISPLKAFTLLELLVTITILAILFTVAFMSVTGFLKKSRDVSRFENLNRMNFWIELFVLEKGFYPEPDNAADITYSWSMLLWSQWTFWDDVTRLIWKLSNKPVDLVSNNDFAYSLANDKKQYELWSVLESSEIMFQDMTSETYAKSKIDVRSMVVWNYNWISLTTSSGWTIYILWLPTILSYDTTDTDIVSLIDKKTLAYRWYGNIASSYTWTVFRIDGWFDFDPSILVLYSGTYDNLINNESEWIGLLENTQEAYSWVVTNNPVIDDILDLVVDPSNPSIDVREIAYDLVNNQLEIPLPVVLTSWDNWVTYEYLLDSDTRSITQDTNFTLWFATKSWVFTSSWNTWTSYTEADWLINKDVRTVIEADDWRMWMATNKWVSVFDWTNWLEYTKSDWLIDDDVVGMIQSSDWHFWFTTKKWVSEFDWTTWTDHTTSDWIANKIVTWIVEASNWHIWISTIDGVSRYNWAVWQTYTEADWLVDKNVLTVEADSSWNVWFGSINWVSKYSGSWLSYNEIDWLVDKYVNDIFVDNIWNTWFATVAWASKLDTSGNWTSFTKDDWLADNDVQVIFQDTDSNIWFGTKKWVTIYFN